MLACLSVLMLCTCFVFGNNTTATYLTEKRQQRFVSFHTNEEGHIEIDLEFAVPFLNIPVKKSLDYAKGSLANINVGAIVLSGTIMAVSIFVFPALMNLFNLKSLFNSTNRNSYQQRRNDDQSSWWRFVANVEQALLENNIDSTTCMQRAVCWTVKNSATKLRTGLATSNDKIIDGLATHRWFHYLIDGSAVHSAVDNGLRDTNCATEYHRCRLTQKSLQGFVKKFVAAINT